MNNSVLLWLLCAVSLCVALPQTRAEADANSGHEEEKPPAAIEFGHKFSLDSKLLDEKRPYWVCLPPSYKPGDHAARRYPVLYLLDGERMFDWVCPVIQFMADNYQIPELIVVGIPHLDRGKDLSPAAGDKELRGEGTRFSQFLIQELMPAIEGRYRTASFRLLVGHSLAGAFAMDNFLRQPQTFQAYVAIDPSLGRNDGELVRRAATALGREKDLETTVFISTACHSPTLVEPNADGTNSIRQASEQFFKILSANTSSGLRKKYEYFDSEHHGSVRMVSLQHGLRFIFQSFQVPSLYSLDEPKAINNHFGKASRELGFEILPPEEIVSEIGYQLLYSGHVERAIGCFRLNESNYPTSVNVFSALGEAYEAKGDKHAARTNYLQVLKLSPKDRDAAKALEKLSSSDAR
jgi:predicted alpha/beta superfamily hydrolase